MTLDHYFSFSRLWAIVVKEFIQMVRDRITLAIIIAIPLMQLILFGYAINSNPKHLPTLIINGDQSYFTRTFLTGMQNSSYFDVINDNTDEKTADHALRAGQAQFVINIPPRFSTDLIRGTHPSILLTVDATDAMAAANSMAAAKWLTSQIFDHDFQGTLSYLRSPPPAFNLTIHPKYNPELISQYNIVPGLLGVVLTMTMVIITALAITREYERGTMEFLLATPVQPIEVMLGKVIPYIIVGYIQVLLLLVLAIGLFQVPCEGSVTLLLLSALPFIFANLSVGIMFSTIAENQLQATQLSFFYFLPAVLLTGFMFPFNGMPAWAEAIGDILPLTYFLRIVRGIMLKGNGWVDTWPNIWPILVFMTIALIIGVLRYRKTLD